MRSALENVPEDAEEGEARCKCGSQTVLQSLLLQVWLQSGCKCQSHTVVDSKAMCPAWVGAYDKSITST